MSSVSIQAVSRTFEGHKGQRTQALLPVDFEVRDNDFVTILGPSGCGKSTLLRIVAGLDHATSGRVLLDGVPVEGPGADRGMVFQSYTLFPWLTIEQNIRFGLRERGMPEAQQKERAAYFIAKVGLRGFEQHFPKQLSGGMQHRHCARAGQRPQDFADGRALRRAGQPDPRAHARVAAGHLGGRTQDSAVCDP